MNLWQHSSHINKIAVLLLGQSMHGHPSTNNLMISVLNRHLQFLLLLLLQWFLLVTSYRANGLFSPLLRSTSCSISFHFPFLSSLSRSHSLLFTSRLSSAPRLHLSASDSVPYCSPSTNGCIWPWPWSCKIFRASGHLEKQNVGTAFLLLNKQVAQLWQRDRAAARCMLQHSNLRE